MDEDLSPDNTDTYPVPYLRSEPSYLSHLASPVAMKPVAVAVDDAAAVRAIIAGDGADGEGGRDGVLENDARAGASAHLRACRNLTMLLVLVLTMVGE